MFQAGTHVTYEGRFDLFHGTIIGRGGPSHTYVIQHSETGDMWICSERLLTLGWY